MNNFTPLRHTPLPRHMLETPQDPPMLPPHTRNPFVGLAIFFTIVGLVGICGYSISQQMKTNENIRNVLGISDVNLNNNQSISTYRNNEYAVAFSYPSTFNASEKDKSDNNELVHTNFIRFDPFTEIDFEINTKSLEDMRTVLVPSSYKVDFMQLAGVQAVRYLPTQQTGQNDYKEIVMFNKNARTYIFTLKAAADTQLLDNILTTLSAK